MGQSFECTPPQKTAVCQPHSLRLMRNIAAPHQWINLSESIIMITIAVGFLLQVEMCSATWFYSSMLCAWAVRSSESIFGALNLHQTLDTQSGRIYSVQYQATTSTRIAAQEMSSLHGVPPSCGKVGHDTSSATWCTFPTEQVNNLHDT